MFGKRERCVQSMSLFISSALKHTVARKGRGNSVTFCSSFNRKLSTRVIPHHSCCFRTQNNNCTVL